MKQNSLPLGFHLALLLSVFLISGCSSSITRADLQKKQFESPQPLIVDVRSAGEYAADHIPGAVHIPFYSIGSGLDDRAIPKEKTIVLYCEHGPRAGLAGISLYFHGYVNVYSLEGHMKGWRGDGFPLERGTDSR